jgi:predicted CopG family antitoxin
MSKKRLRIKESSGEHLKKLQREDERSYSDVLDRVLPNPEEANGQLQKSDKISISVSDEIRERVFALAEEGVPAHRVVEYYLHRHEIEQVVAADELLDRLYNRDNEE